MIGDVEEANGIAYFSKVTGEIRVMGCIDVWADIYDGNIGNVIHQDR